MTLVYCLDNPSAHGCGAPSLCCKWWKGKLHRWQTKSCVCDHQTSRASVDGSGWKVVRQTAWQRSGHMGSDLEGEVSSSGPRTFFNTGFLRSSCRAGTGSGYDSVPPRTLNELSDQGNDASVDLIMRIEAECGWPNLCSRIVFVAKAAGGVRPAGLQFAIVRVQCTLRPSGPRLGAASSDVSGSRLGAKWSTADGHAVGTILYDVLKLLDHVPYQRLVDAAVCTSLPLRQPGLLVDLYQGARHVDLAAHTDTHTHAHFFCVVVFRHILRHCAHSQHFYVSRSDCQNHSIKSSLLICLA